MKGLAAERCCDRMPITWKGVNCDVTATWGRDIRKLLLAGAELGAFTGAALAADVTPVYKARSTLVTRLTRKKLRQASSIGMATSR